MTPKAEPSPETAEATLDTAEAAEAKVTPEPGRRVRVQIADDSSVFDRDLEALSAPLATVPPEPAPGPSKPRAVSTLEALLFPFERERWLRRVVIASLWVLIPVLGWLAVRGWITEARRRLERHHPDPLPIPRLRDFLHYVRTGVTSAVVEFAALAVVVGLVGVAVLLLNAGLWAAVLSGGPLALGLLGVVAFTSLTVLGLGTVLSTTILTRTELSGSLSVALQSGEVWPLARRAALRTLGSWLLFGLMSTVVLALGGALLCVGLLPALVIANVAAMHLRHQIYLEQRRRGAAAVKLADTPLLPTERRLLERGKIEDRAG